MHLRPPPNRCTTRPGCLSQLAAASGHAQQVGMRVLHASGIQSEAQLPFAGLDQLVMPVLDHADGLPSPQHTALLAAFGMAEEEAPDRFLIALAVLELLADAAERAPLLLVVVDDSQWLDRSTVGVLAFVARRVEHEPIGVIEALRAGSESSLDDAGLTELRLGGLDGAASESLLDTHNRHFAWAAP